MTGLIEPPLVRCWKPSFESWIAGAGLRGRKTRCVATFKNQQESDWLGRPDSVSCNHLEQLVDELNLLPNIRTVHSPRLPLPDHVHGLVSLDRSPRRVELTKALLGLHASFDRSMSLVQDVVQVLNMRWPRKIGQLFKVYSTD